MQFYYGEKMPLRILDEGEFWKRQEAEHTDVIRALVPNLEAPFVQALKVWEQALSQTEAVFVRYIEMVVRMGHPISPAVYGEIMNLLYFALEQSWQFVQLLNQLGLESQALKTNPTAITVLNHIRRESEYFIGIAEALLQVRK
ncbi:DUF2935 domain-containing protein [Aneurinibacillus aneurinilyticus]|jgi:hypothetical protein|uniref:DUF2935 domain-containing protein n=2 Tax=Aneurinibacillus aneurinilyticus TaxID=1391 RepID=A0A848CQL8_ANEAE|nr:DUF2935 domain-containing protein [Aneurinibacillus aneurinilyticus]ERI11452.1 hypothetical protein HMPREF0083_00439 [Aneurinibacillus aneurinilyticus ATCC 12856]MCI1694222.1 DUF2935 domain-containing protein [Aneurinibacillus aneurinilyticus]MED0707756.1 DUF2935 domain-containing protein [Aneurinibacillus aneurinilyticus]MED0722421.1 DUF2935 domain-containing protein [Aneurinibacillus aneurinilyticus]MED0733119.1 DUF2935 domain-containing protein [Aneurinibacillus aneurinilyticus]